jgi:hypothetical protein
VATLVGGAVVMAAVIVQATGSDGSVREAEGRPVPAAETG